MNKSIGEQTKPTKVGEYCFDEEIVVTDFDQTKNLSPTEKNMKKAQENKTVEHIMKKQRFTIGLQDGKMTPLPPNFSFPKMNTQQLVVNWLLGNVEANLPPYQTFHRSHLMHNTSDRKSTRLNSSHSQQSRMPSSA